MSRVRFRTCLSCATCAWWRLSCNLSASQATAWKGMWARDCATRGRSMYQQRRKWWVKLTAILSKPILRLFPGFSVLLLLDTNLQTWYESYLTSAYLNLTVGTCQSNEQYSLWMWPSLFWVNYAQRKKLFEGYWASGSFDIQSAYLCGCVKVLNIKRRYSGQSSRGSHTLVYYVSNGAVSTRACKVALEFTASAMVDWIEQYVLIGRILDHHQMTCVATTFPPIRPAKLM